MTSNPGYQRLSPDSVIGSQICPTHRLLNYTKVQAQLDAAAIREAAVADTPGSRAQASPCDGTGNWHILIPTKARMQTLRKRERKARGTPVDVPRETKDDHEA